MTSNPLFIIPDFFCLYQMNLAMATLDLKEMGKLLWEGSEKSCPVGCLSLALLNLDSQQGRPFSLPSEMTFPISFKPMLELHIHSGVDGIYSWK